MCAHARSTAYNAGTQNPDTVGPRLRCRGAYAPINMLQRRLHEFQQGNALPRDGQCRPLVLPGNRTCMAMGNYEGKTCHDLHVLGRNKLA